MQTGLPSRCANPLTLFDGFFFFVVVVVYFNQTWVVAFLL